MEKNKFYEAAKESIHMEYSRHVVDEIAYKIGMYEYFAEKDFEDGLYTDLEEMEE